MYVLLRTIVWLHMFLVNHHISLCSDSASLIFTTPIWTTSPVLCATPARLMSVLTLHISDALLAARPYFIGTLCYDRHYERVL